MPTTSIPAQLGALPAARTGDATPSAPVVVQDLSREVLRLTRGSHAMRAQLAARGAQAGAKGDAIGGVEWSAYLLLCPLVRLGPQRSSVLADAAHVDPSTISRQVTHLVDLGLVQRRADPEDGRATLLVATERGVAVHAQVQERRERAYAAMVADWPPDDVRRLAHLLGRLNDSFATHRTRLLEAISGEQSTTEPTQEITS